MELVIIIAILVIAYLGWTWATRETEVPTNLVTTEQSEAAPYKVPEPAAVTPIPMVVEVAPEVAPVVAEVAPVVEAKPKRKPAARTTATKATAKAPAKKPAAKAVAAKKPATKKKSA